MEILCLFCTIHQFSQMLVPLCRLHPAISTNEIYIEICSTYTTSGRYTKIPKQKMVTPICANTNINTNAKASMIHSTIFDKENSSLL